MGQVPISPSLACLHPCSWCLESSEQWRGGCLWRDACAHTGAPEAGTVLVKVRRLQSCQPCLLQCDGEPGVFGTCWQPAFIHYLWDSGKGFQVYWTWTHLWEMNWKHCLSPLTQKNELCVCELRAFPSPSSCSVVCPKWVGLKRKLSSLLDERGLKYPQAPTKQSSSFSAFHCATLSQSQRAAVFLGRVHRAKK